MTVTEAGRALAAGKAAPVSAGRAAQELALRRGDFDLAVHLGLIRAEPVACGARPRIRREEIDRLRALPGFPDSLREQVRTAGTAEGATLLGVGTSRFTGLARIGCISPVAFCLNRYRTVVWLYLVEELLAFAAREPHLVAGKSPVGMRTMLEAGTDRRARNWRSRRVDRLLNRTEDPWGRAALQATALDPVQLAEVVDDPYERAYLARMAPDSPFGRPASVSGREAMARMVLADDPDEILWRRVNLTLELEQARQVRSAPRPGCDPALRPLPAGPARSLPEVTARDVPAPDGRRSAPRRPGRASSGPVARLGAGRGLLVRIGLCGPGRRAR
ncbi:MULTISPECIES: DUF6397 family protein [Streptomyces]|uniref:DUF6397 family protein n=1 Tax=Streptomyces glycanivorans TaxID=3033808 RepID=A0ABY9J7J1_9ACTN|nr:MULTISPECIES: DUF6397 family protein [unclassified Streptomyces]WSQ75754.1 DUF6397 family protein [Streptomyces sp. NBC_01213]TXS15679.1 hypothetical protein EAO68_17110 [Streptomyces sp. wa22]WLQ62248.1 DUF6397 family protein [Streptomyces sp. Alt3]WSQ83002.1 DUF6397 family protein [Streptomyces sp. NBC_01212]WSR10970.1 DUF6397 family protein [Streptomyces sp. NBC_01208]